MNLPSFLPQQAEISKTYLALIIGDAQVQAALWQASSTGVEILENSARLSYQPSRELTIKADQALQTLSSASEAVDEVVFGLTPNWTDQEGILSVKKPILKNLTEKLNLKAVGFVVTAEAMAKHLTQSQSRLSCLLLEIGQNYLSLNYIKQGQLVLSKQVGRSDQLLADMTEALARLNAHHEDQHQEQLQYPSKILVASFELKKEELVEAQQLLISHDWVNSHPFHQMPTIDLLDKKQFLEAVIKQGGKSVAAAAGVTVVAEKVKETAVAETTASSFGVPLKLEQLPPEKKKVSPQPTKKKTGPKSEAKKKNRQGWPMKIFNWFKQHKLFVIGGFVAGLVTLAVVGYWWLAANTQAYLDLKLVTQPVSREASLTLDVKLDQSDPEKLILAASKLTETVTETASKESTGAKLVGEKAKGTVTLYNKTEASKTFEAGTNLSKGNLNFTLDEMVEVASASVETTASGENKEYGQVETAITATEIGAEANLEAEAELQIENYDLGTYAAIVKEKLSGGSSREVRVVSADDQEELLADLTEKLLTTAAEKMKTQLEPAERLVFTEQYQVAAEEYSAAVGDEVNTFDLKLELIVEALLYQQEDLIPLAQEVLAADVPTGYTLIESEPQILSDPVKDATQSGTVQLKVNLSAEAQPELDLNQLKADLAGKKLFEAERLLIAKEEIEAVEIKLQPALAKRLRPRLPKDQARLKFE